MLDVEDRTGALLAPHGSNAGPRRELLGATTEPVEQQRRRPIQADQPERRRTGQMVGNGHLQAIEIVTGTSEQRRTVETPAVFSFIGATPRTDWLPAEVERDSKGFVQTGGAVAQSPHWGLARAPFLLETSRRGVFAAGDVRSGSVKRVASAVGEGAMAVQFVHEYLKEM